VAAAANGDDEKRKPCFSLSLPEARAVAISRDGRYAGAGDLEAFHVLAGGLAPTGFLEFGFRPVHMAPHPGRGPFAVAAGNVHLVDMEARKAVAELEPPSWFVAWRREGAELLAIDYDNTVRVWDAATRKELARWRLPLGRKLGSRFEDYADAAGLLALGFDDGSVRVFDVADGRQVSRFDAHPAEGKIEMTGMALSPDGRLLATCDYGQVKLWDAATGEMRRRFPTKGGLASLVRFYAKGRRLAFANHVGSGYGFDFLDAETGERLARAAVTGNDAVESWDMALADTDEPTILLLANGTVYLCPWSAATAKAER
jgi:WD40 repeat protein